MTKTSKTATVHGNRTTCCDRIAVLHAAWQIWTCAGCRTPVGRWTR